MKFLKAVTHEAMVDSLENFKMAIKKASFDDLITIKKIVNFKSKHYT
jgi:hypothetical protein